MHVIGGQHHPANGITGTDEKRNFSARGGLLDSRVGTRAACFVEQINGLRAILVEIERSSRQGERPDQADVERPRIDILKQLACDFRLSLREAYDAWTEHLITVIP